MKCKNYTDDCDNANICPCLNYAIDLKYDIEDIVIRSLKAVTSDKNDSTQVNTGEECKTYTNSCTNEKCLYLFKGKFSTTCMKKLRETTGALLMNCKKALAESDGIEELAILYLKYHDLPIIPMDHWITEDGKRQLEEYEREKENILNKYRKE